MPKTSRSRRPAAALLLAVTTAAPFACADGGGSRPVDAEQVAAGRQVYLNTCATCHGRDARGIPGLGKGLHDSELVRSDDDEQLLELLATGRPASHPSNTTGVDMPPRGGDPELTDEDLRAVVAYLHTLS